MSLSFDPEINPSIPVAVSAILAVVSFVGLGSAAAVAQPQDAELAACAEIETEAARLACYDRVIQGASAASEIPDQRDAPGDPVIEVPNGAEPDVSVGEVVDAPGNAVGNPGGAAAGVVAARPSAEAEPAAAARSAARTDAVPEERDSVELEVEEFPQSRAERRAARRAESGESSESFSVMVVQHLENLSGLGVFVSEGGEIFDQVSARRSRFPAVPFPADLEPASRGSYWLTTELGGRPIRVVKRK